VNAKERKYSTVTIWHFFTRNFAVAAYLLLSPWQFTGLHIFPTDVISRATVHTSLVVSFSPHNDTFLDARGLKVHRLLKNMKS
jgi:hypothetical protein